MNKRLVVITALGAAVSAAALLPIPASAHNAAHMELPGGSCINIGSGKSVILPDNANAYTTALGERDLIPSTATRDEIGARFAVEQGNTPLLAGHSAACD